MTEMPVFSKNFEEFYQVSEPKMSNDPTFNPFDHDGYPEDDYKTQSSSQQSFLSTPQTYHTQQYLSQKQDYGKLFEDNTMAMSKLPMVVQGKYIITSVRNGLMVTNIRRAKERILYERFLKAISRNEHLTQTTLFPVQMQVGVEQCLVFQEHQQLLESLGFDIAIFGSDTVVVNGVPEGYSAEPGKVQDMLYNLAAILSEDHSSLQLTMASTMADRFARVGASSCDGDLSPTQAKQLIDELFGCENSEYTISGRKIMVLLSVDELDKKF
jgi:DNA mismatch repair protein MutL